MPAQVQELTLPLENLPERFVPPRKSYTAHFLSISSETQKMLDECDWSLYESAVETGLVKAVKRYKGSSMGAEAISQVSFGTDPQRQITEISFETKRHAEAEVRTRAEGFRTRNLHDLAERLESAGYNPNPGEFQCPNYYTILHRELRPLDRIDYDDTENVRAAGVWIETFLLRVVECIRARRLLAELPQEDGVWLGVSSTRDWYDHVIKV